MTWKQISVTTAILMAAYWVLTGHGDRADNESAGRQVSDAEIAWKTVDLDLSYYDKSQWPQVYLRYGERTVRGELQALRREAARKAATFTACDKVGSSDYAPSRSAIDNIVIYVDCENGFRIYYDKTGVLETHQY